MRKRKKSGAPAGAIVFVVCLFVAVLAGSIFIQLLTSPKFQGFGVDLPFGEASGRSQPTGGAEGGPDGEGAYSWKDHPVFIVGDSLTVGAEKDISKTVANATVDAKVGRNMSEGLNIIREWDDSGILADDAIIVVCLAHNITGSTISDAEQIVDIIKPGQSLIMMTGHGKSNMTPINEYLRELPYKYPYITLADWDLTIVQSPGLLSDDGVHVGNKQGNKIYADLILLALEAAKPRP
ncbi:MAG: hypothetical protein FWG03_05845 [Clostridiales bacterium]|nr:hypothetical protein [Clostridiales bacterium]